MPTNAYVKDNQIRVSVEFLANSVDTDPTTVKCFYKSPGGTITTLTYGVDNALIKDATGKYHVDIFANVTGLWYYRFEGTGALIGANESEFSIDLSQLV